ncbi:uncharacterized protein B0P05DRAFT_87498 [Gilbertella persicaria]|uniref:uncharacterized protein n=1 Tax=Gilbertella persicaria TaxID=101096 RepID=UPI002220CE8F|nr:uncharacterized protein B0P05DRAFT_87498 [Gilbertella persicaria]KAI8079595.1 hypothetical protein B0P05DRAFT_87498 [Gilbertella persicaria]
MEQTNETVAHLRNEIKTLKTSNLGLVQQIDSYEKLALNNKQTEEALKIQILDLQQELNQLKKSEKNTKIKYNRLNTSFETLQLTHEALVKEHDAMLSKKETQLVPAKSFSDQNKNTCLDMILPEPIPNTKRPTKVPAEDKINATDTRVLNRRLRRVFDMSELSDLSNSILSTILVELSNYRTQFDWVHDTPYFYPLVASIQQLLTEISTMRMTLNDLQADYVRRIERLTTSHTVYTSMVANYNIKHRIPKEFPQRIRKRSVENKASFMQGLMSFFNV